MRQTMGSFRKVFLPSPLAGPRAGGGSIPQALRLTSLAQQASERIYSSRTPKILGACTDADPARQGACRLAFSRCGKKKESLCPGSPPAEPTPAESASYCHDNTIIRLLLSVAVRCRGEEGRSKRVARLRVGWACCQIDTKSRVLPQNRVKDANGIKGKRLKNGYGTTS
jgi:hypothetical protein